MKWVDDFKAEPEMTDDNSVRQQILLASASKDYLQALKKLASITNFRAQTADMTIWI